ncbi:uncharacterized protein LOC144861007 [Branchiostoma floridae x Branchiostoma japonicum]
MIGVGGGGGVGGGVEGGVGGGVEGAVEGAVEGGAEGGVEGAVEGGAEGGVEGGVGGGVEGGVGGGVEGGVGGGVAGDVAGEGFGESVGGGAVGDGSGTWLAWSLPSGSITSAGTPGANAGPAIVLDGNPNTYWSPQGLPRNHNNWWIIFDMQKTYTISGFKLQNFGDNTHDVTNFKLETSNDGSTWTQVFSTGSVRPGTTAPQPFGGFYGTGRYWRFTATRTASGWQPYLVGLMFYGVEGTPNNKALTMSTSGISSSGTAGAQNGPQNTVDGNPNTYWSPQGLPMNHNNWWIIFDFQRVYTLSAIRVTNYGDTTHDVTAFKLETSDDKVTWQPVYSTSGVRPGTNQPQMFGGFSGTGRYWRFTVTRTASGNQPYLVGLMFYTIIRRQEQTHFKVVGMLKTVAEAKEYCKTDQNGHLADVRSKALLDFLMTTINDIGKTKNYWMGLHDATGEGGWEWADGAPLSSCSYKNWAPGEPSNIGEHTCVQLWAAKGFQWDTDDCGEKKFFICQKGPGDTSACRGQYGREVEADVGPEDAMEEVMREEEPEVEDGQADDISRDMSVSWEEQEADDVIAREVGDTPDDVIEPGEEAGSEVEEDIEEIEEILEELSEVEDEQNFDFEPDDYE